jgi:hemolysin activation/secretion protein
MLFSLPGRAPLGDKFTLSFYTTLDIEEQRAARITYQRGLTASGLVGAVEVAYGEAEPGGEVRVLGAAAESVSARFGLSYPIHLGRTSRVHVGAGLDGSDQSGELFGGQVNLSEDSSRNVFARIEGEASPGCARFTATPNGACWRLAGEVEVRQGVEGLGASKKGDALLARPFADPQASLIRGALDAETPDTLGFRARLQLTGQAADEPLMAYEEYTLGNYTMVRGYDPGAIAGDSGVAGSLEIIAPDFRLRQLAVEPFAFYDAGRIWNEDPGAVNGRDVASAGAGMRFTLERGLRLEAAWVRPLHAPLGLGESEPSSRVLFSLTTSVSRLFRQTV